MALTDFLPCAVLIPSLGRPHRLKDVAKNVHESTTLDHVILWQVGGFKSLEVIDELDEPCVVDDSDKEDKRYVTRMNNLITHAKLIKCRSVFFGSDDVVHHEGWLEAALAEMEEQQKAVIVVNDLRNPNGTQAVVRVDYFPFLVHDDPTVAFHPGYQHNFADTEMFQTAQKYGQLGRAMDSNVEHLHPIYQNNTARPWDDTYRGAMSHWQEDGKRFGERMESLQNEAPEVVESKKHAIERFWGIERLWNG